MQSFSSISSHLILLVAFAIFVHNLHSRVVVMSVVVMPDQFGQLVHYVYNMIDKNGLQHSTPKSCFGCHDHGLNKATLYTHHLRWEQL